MSDFRRGLNERALASLEQLSQQRGDNWWKDLLKAWKPSGTAAGEKGLRLAVRNNYLNFYLRGQSVARVGFTHDSEPYVESHVKYVFERRDDIHDKDTTRPYARLTGTTILHACNTEGLSYQGESTLHEWMKRAAEHKGDEKVYVDALVEDNPAIIDLEMGLPAVGKEDSALRIDCVALEQDANVIRIVLWEAKRIEDSRLRSETEPDVINQVNGYREYLSNLERAQHVEVAYRDACGLLLQFGAMASSLGNRVNLDESIVKAAVKGSNLKVDPDLRLVIFRGKDHKNQSSWPPHEDKLRNTYKVPYLIFAEKPYALSRPK